MGDTDGEASTGDTLGAACEGAFDGAWLVVGERLGACDAVGAPVVGACDGNAEVGAAEGDCVGSCDGVAVDGALEGASVGDADGWLCNGEAVGMDVGDVEGRRVGRSLGARVGSEVLPSVGRVVGLAVGASVSHTVATEMWIMLVTFQSVSVKIRVATGCVTSGCDTYVHLHSLRLSMRSGYGLHQLHTTHVSASSLDVHGTELSGLTVIWSSMGRPW